jgi:hypothetical protein
MKRRKKRGRKKMKKTAETEKHVAGRKRGEGKAAGEKRAAVAALVAADVPKEQALIMAGYSPNNKKPLADVRVKETVSQMRERLQMTKGYTVEDSAKFYRDIANDNGNDVSKRVQARTRMDSLLGNDASKKVEVSETREVTKVAVMLSNLRIGNQKVNPSDLLELAKDVESGLIGSGE